MKKDLSDQVKSQAQGEEENLMRKFGFANKTAWRAMMEYSWFRKGIRKHRTVTIDTAFGERVYMQLQQKGLER